MKTKIHIQTASSNAFGVNYNHMTIDVLTERFKGSRYLEPIGHISFQSNKDTPNDWYGIKFNVMTEKPEYIDKMAKIAKVIMSNRSGYNAQPDEIIELIGGQEYIFFDQEFIAKKDNGKKIFNVFRQGNLYERIVAASESQAKKLLDKKKIEGVTLKLSTVISF